MTTNGEHNGAWQESGTSKVAESKVERKVGSSLDIKRGSDRAKRATQRASEYPDSVEEGTQASAEVADQESANRRRDRLVSKAVGRRSGKRSLKKTGPVHASGKEIALCWPFHPREVYPLVSELNGFLGEHEAKHKNSAHKKGIQVHASLRVMCLGLGIANSGKNRQLLVRAKRLLRHLGLCIFKRVYQIGLKLADLFFLTSPFNFRKSKILKERLYQERREKQSQSLAPQNPVFVVGVVVLGYPKSWDEVVMEGAC